MQREPVRQEEREVGDAGVDRALLVVVDALEEAGELQHVLRHALAPLAARLGARQRLAQPLGGLRQLGHVRPLRIERVGELAELAATVGLELAHELVDPLQLGVHRRQLLIDQPLLALEVAAGELALAVHQRLAARHQVLERGRDGGVARGLGALALLVGQAAHLARELACDLLDDVVGGRSGGHRLLRRAPPAERDHRADHDDSDHNSGHDPHQHLHAPRVARGCDSYADRP